jgi:hypothetical protein
MLYIVCHALNHLHFPFLLYYCFAASLLFRHSIICFVQKKNVWAAWRFEPPTFVKFGNLDDALDHSTNSHEAHEN